MADEPGMEKGELRKLLTIAKKTPVNAAIGMMKDGTPALLLHKVKQPRALSKELESSGGDLKNMRWGEFYVDEAEDPRTLIARINKPVSGLARRLVKIVKFAGFSKVMLQYEDGTSELGGEEDEEQPAADAAPSAPAAAAPEPAPAAAPAQKSGEDFGPITARITALVKQMLPLIAADPSRADPLKALGRQAQAALQGRDMKAAENAAKSLEQEIAGAQAGAAAAPASAAAAGAAQAGAAAPAAIDPATIAKARTAWLAVRQKIDGDLAKLLKAVSAAYQDHGALAEIEQRVQKELDGVLDALDEELAHKLDEVGKAPAAERAKLAAEAKQIAARYQQHIATDKVLGALDDNPFVPLTVQKTVTTALSAIVRTLH